MRFVLKAAVVLLLIAIGAAAFAIDWTFGHYAKASPLPEAQLLAAMSAANGVCRGDNARRQFVRLDDIPPLVRHAVIAAEDPDFLDRDPFNPLLEIARYALFDGYRVPRGTALSTFLARCLIWRADCCRKNLEWQLALAVTGWRVETTVSKDAILEVFLNEAWFGRGSFGVAAAAQSYFGKALSDLTVDEAAYLAALPRAPSHFGKNVERGMERRNVVIDRMLEVGVLGSVEARSAKQRPLVLAPPS